MRIGWAHSPKYSTANALGADYEAFSQSGYGFMWSWYGNPKESMPRFYDQICGLVPIGKASELGAHDKYDFSSFAADDVIMLKKGAKLFLKKIREKRPDAVIIWAYGMLLQDSDSINEQMPRLLSEAVAEFSEEEEDSKVFYHQLPPTLDTEYGARSHPGYMAHKKAADSLVKKIESVV